MASADLKKFDYQKVAQLETDMWRAYYNHRFLKMFKLLVELIRTQLRLSWYLSVRLAWYSASAATIYRLKKGREDYDQVLKRLQKFFKLLSKHSNQSFDYKKAARLELEWWNIHRYPDKYQKPLEASLAEGMAFVYKVDARKLKAYARLRAAAMAIPDHEGDNQEQPPDWHKVNALLVKAWGAFYKALQK